LPCTLRKPEGDRQGFGEPPLVRKADVGVKFEWIGFARIDDASGDRIVAYYPTR
jgi:hypothetical protein